MLWKRKSYAEVMWGGSSRIPVPCLDICFEHEGRLYGARVLLEGPYSRVRDAKDPAAEALVLLQKSVKATRWLLEHRDTKYDALPTWVKEVANASSTCCDMHIDANPVVVWSVAPEDPMRVRGWEPL